MSKIKKDTNHGGPVMCDNCRKRVKNGGTLWRKSGLFFGGTYCSKSCAQA